MERPITLAEATTSDSSNRKRYLYHVKQDGSTHCLHIDGFRYDVILSYGAEGKFGRYGNFPFGIIWYPKFKLNVGGLGGMYSAHIPLIPISGEGMNILIQISGGWIHSGLFQNYKYEKFPLSKIETPEIKERAESWIESQTTYEVPEFYKKSFYDEMVRFKKEFFESVDSGIHIEIDGATYCIPRSEDFFQFTEQWELGVHPGWKPEDYL